MYCVIVLCVCGPLGGALPKLGCVEWTACRRLEHPPGVLATVCMAKEQSRTMKTERGFGTFGRQNPPRWRSGLSRGGRGQCISQGCLACACWNRVQASTARKSRSRRRAAWSGATLTECRSSSAPLISVISFPLLTGSVDESVCFLTRRWSGEGSENLDLKQSFDSRLNTDRGLCQQSGIWNRLDAQVVATDAQHVAITMPAKYSSAARRIG